jgi:hypothetical protein
MMWIALIRTWQDTHGLTPIFLTLFVSLDYRATMWMLLILLVLLLVPTRVGARRVLTWLGEYPITTASATTGVLCAGALLVYRAHPLAMDEYAPLFQSQAFAAGHLTGQFPAGLLDALIPKGFQNYFLNVSPVSGEVASTYWPSFALLLTPFTWLGIPWACNPVLSGMTVVVIHRLAMRLFGNLESAGLAVLLTVASPGVLCGRYLLLLDDGAHALQRLVRTVAARTDSHETGHRRPPGIGCTYAPQPGSAHAVRRAVDRLAGNS